MKIVVACGGTGGHAFPGLAVAAELKRRGHEVVVWNSGREIESRVMRDWDGPTFSTGARQLSAKNLFALVRSFYRCRKEVKRMKPEALLAMGSYSSLPPVLAAALCGVPVYLHEANTVPGRAVEFLSRFARKVAISFEETAHYLPNVKTVRTGLPVRAGIEKGERFASIPKNAFVVFVTGGSQGAHAVNELMMQALALFHRDLVQNGKVKEQPLYVIHQTGAKDEGAVMACYAREALPSRVQAFEHEMANAFASADVVVARAGASTCFELAACGKPAFLIPLPTALRDHQHLNAASFVSAGGAEEGVQARLTARSAERYLMNLYQHPDKLADMSAKMRNLAMPDAASRVADLVTGEA